MNLIYDRTQSDVDNAIAIRSKYQALGDWSGITEDEIAQLKRGTYSCFDDMNRVDAAVRELGGMLTTAGYPVRYTSPIPQPEPEPTKTEFEIGDIIAYEIWRTYLDNVQSIRDAYYAMPDSPELPEPTAPLTYDGANAIEKLLFDISVLYNAMAASFRKCGTFQSGNNTQRLPLQRSIT